MYLKRISFLLSSVVVMSLLGGCYSEPSPDTKTVGEDPVDPATKTPPKPLTEEFKAYWYSGVAELNSYALEQDRYGEARKGEAVLIFVTEPFNPEKQVKADRQGSASTSVLKLNRVQKFLTGVYPYSIMSSIFYPVSNNKHALKITTSVQEWCGHVYAQLNNRSDFEIQSHSYFEREADQLLQLPHSVLEDELWTQIRFGPDALPQGPVEVIPSLEYLRLRHRPIKSYEAIATLSEEGGIRIYSLTYPELNRTLEIRFERSFPYRIEGWQETKNTGARGEQATVISKASRKKTLKTPYWQKNSNSDVSLRDSLGLELQ